MFLQLLLKWKDVKQSIHRLFTTLFNTTLNSYVSICVRSNIVQKHEILIPPHKKGKFLVAASHCMYKFAYNFKLLHVGKTERYLAIRMGEYIPK